MSLPKKEQDELLAKFLASIDENMESTVKLLTSVAPSAAVKEFDETIDAMRLWEHELGYSNVVTMVLNYTHKLYDALEKLEDYPSDGNFQLLNNVISACSSAHEDAKFDY
jgi:uncharacterized protein YjgD (DUF1641 family)